MPREIIVEHTSPLKIEPADFPRDAEGNLKPIFICRCGISAKMPLCDGTHKSCKDEDPSLVYRYDAQGRSVIGPKAPNAGS